ncbi:MAG: hypothetical protein NVS3B7_16800 [Candidatus Elarobacter sp.]
MLFNIISHWSDFAKLLAAIVVFATGTASALNLLFTALAIVARLFSDRLSAGFVKAAKIVSDFGVEFQKVAIRVGLLADQPVPSASKAPPLPIMVIGGALMLGLSGCAGFFTPARDEQLAKTGIDIAICILNHSQLPALEIVKACDGVTVVDVNNVLSSHKLAAQHELASPAPSGSACSYGDAGSVH